MLLVFIQERMTSPASLVLQGRGIMILSINLDPFIDALPGHSEHAGDIGGTASVVELQYSEGPPKQVGIPSLCKLSLETPPLPRSQVEPAHGLLLHPGDCR